MNDNELFEKASRAWLTRCRRENWIPDQPSASDIEVDLEAGTVTLQNCNGVLADYRYYPKSDRLRYVRVEDTGDQRRPQVHRERSRT